MVIMLTQLIIFHKAVIMVYALLKLDMQILISDVS